MAAKKSAPKKKVSPRFFEQTDLALCLSAMFATLSVVFMVVVATKYL